MSTDLHILFGHTSMAKDEKANKPTDTVVRLIIAMLAMVAVFAISAAYKVEVPLIVYAIIAGAAFGIENIGKIFGK